MRDTTFYPEPDDFAGPVPIPQAEGSDGITDELNDELLDSLTMLDDQASAPEGLRAA